MERTIPPLQEMTDVKQDVTKFANEIRAFLPDAEVWIFGSYAKGCPHENSDIDVAVILPNQYLDPDDYIRLQIKVFSIGSDINYYMEPLVCVDGHDLFNTIETQVRKPGIRIA